jgi:flagellar biosynthesis protein FlhB
MASETDQGERSEEATPQRREDFRKRGQVVQTKELSAVLLIFTCALLMFLMSGFFYRHLSETFHMSMGPSLADFVRQGEVLALLPMIMLKMAYLTIPAMGLLWLVAMISSAIQVGFLYNEEALQFKWQRLDPVQGLKRMFSLRSLIEGLKAILKMVVILGIAYIVLYDQLFELPRLTYYTIPQTFLFLGELTLRLLVSVGMFMVVLAGLDYLYQRWEMEREMRMTKQEVKEEVKSREGDPMIRARIKRIQREVATKRMMEDVPKATVIVTNPTHISVALRYDDDLVAPQVIAKGAELVAMRIREIAKANNIPIVENKPLARTMFKTIKIGQIIPRELYAAVAEVLSYVYKLRRRKG